MNELLDTVTFIVDVDKELQSAIEIADPHPSLTENTTSTTLAELLSPSE